MLTSMTVTELLDAFAAPTPTPGGGSAAALAGALGASLLAMVAVLPKTKSGTPEERTALDGAHRRLTTLRSTLTDLIDRDSAAYDLVVSAYKKPKATDDEKAARKSAIQDAMKEATTVPLETMRACADVVTLAKVVAEHGLGSAQSDVGVGTNLARAGGAGGLMNVETNLDSVSDEAFVSKTRAELRELQARLA